MEGPTAGEARTVTCVGGIVNIPVRNLNNISCTQIVRMLERELGAGADMITSTTDQGTPMHKITVPLALLQHLVREATAVSPARSYALELRIVAALCVALALLIAFSRTCPPPAAASATFLCTTGHTLDRAWSAVWAYAQSLVVK
jgi:hypothetical protein